MDREKLFRHMQERYVSKREFLSRIPLGVQPDALWLELLNRRRAGSTVLPLYGCNGTPYWFSTTDRMVASSDKIVEALLENDTDFDPYTEAPTVSTLEEVFYTSYVEGSPMTMQAAMDFLTGGQPPRDIEEQLITNNRLAGSYAGANLYHPIETGFLRELAEILTDGMDGGGGDFRTDDRVGDAPASEEQFVFPPARDIPQRLSELTAFLAAPLTHPLIKAAAAQAYIMVLRPFPDGNERLGRILSCMILLRAGYTFFGDVSLSALIARKSYGYYEAVANILREENGGDMTYFMEYFMELLSRAVDERRLRLSRIEDQARQTEQELARTPLAPAPSPPFSPGGGPGGKKPAARNNMAATTDSITEMDDADAAQPDAAVTDCGYYQTVMAGIETTRPDTAAADCDGCQKVPPADILENRPVQEILGELSACLAENPNTTIGLLARSLMEKLRAGQLLFSISEMAASLNLLPRQFCMAIRRMKERGFIRFVSKDSHQTYYRICAENEAMDPPYVPSGSSGTTPAQVSSASFPDMQPDGVKDPACMPQLGSETDSGQMVPMPDHGQMSSLSDSDQAFPIPDSDQAFPFSDPYKNIPNMYDQDVLDQINTLERSNSPKDRRIAELLLNCLPRGEITADDYEDARESTKWGTDMLLAAQLGLVKKISPRRYAILRKLNPSLGLLSNSQKKFITEIYSQFGRDMFSCDMVIATLDYSRSAICGFLHQFTLLRILDCHKENVFWYRFVVNLEQSPECFGTVA